MFGQQDPQQVHQFIVKCVETAYSPSSSELDRKNAHEGLLNFSQNSDPFTLQLAFEFASMNNVNVKAEFRHQLYCFFYDALSIKVIFFWDKFTQAQQKQCKEYVLANLAMANSNEIFNSFSLHQNYHLMEKAVKVFAEIMKREWPQKWPDLMEVLDSIANTGGNCLEMVIIIFRTLAEHLFQPLGTQIPKNRKKDLLKAMRESTKDILILCGKVLDLALPLCQTVPAAGMQIKVVLSYFQAIFEHTDVSLIPPVIYNSLLALLNVEEYRLETIEIFLLLVFHKRPKPEKILLTDMLKVMDMFATPVSKMMAVESDNLDDDGYLFLKNYCEFLTLLGTNVIIPAVSDDLFKPSEQNMLSYFQLQLSFFNHDSVTISKISVDFWIAALNVKSIFEWIESLGSLEQILKSCANKVGNFDINEPYYDFLMRDCDSLMEAKDCQSQSRNGIYGLLQTITSSTPLFSLHVLNRLMNDLGKELQQYNITTPAVQELMQKKWFALSRVWEKMLSKIPKTVNKNSNNNNNNNNDNDKKNKELDNSLKDCFCGLVHFGFPPNQQMWKSYISMFSPFLGDYSFLNECPQELVGFIQLLFQGLQFKPEGMVIERSVCVTKRMGPIIEFRADTARMFVKVCTEMPNLVMPFLNQLNSQIETFLKSDDILLSEKPLLYESLIALNISSAQGLNNQVLYINQILAPFTNYWMQNVANHLVSRDQFILLFGNEENQFNYHHNRIMILSCLQIFGSVCQPTHGLALSNVDEYQTLVKNIVQSTLPLFKLISEMWSNDLLAIPKWKCILEQSIEDKRKVVYGNKIEGGEERDAYHHIRNWIHSLREHCLSVINKALNFHFMLEPSIVETIFQAIIHKHENLQIRFYKPIFRCFLTPLVGSKAALRNQLEPVMAKTLDLFYNKINFSWNSLAQQNLNELDDCVHKRDHTNAAVFLSKIFTTPIAQKIEGKFSDLALWIFQTPNLFPCVIKLIFGSLVWPDKAVAGLNSRASTFMVEGIMQRTDCHSVIPDVLSIMIQCLALHGDTDHIKRDLTITFFTFYKMFPNICRTVFQNHQITENELMHYENEALEIERNSQNVKKKESLHNNLMGSLLEKLTKVKDCDKGKLKIQMAELPQFQFLTNKAYQVALEKKIKSEEIYDNSNLFV